MLWPDAFSHFGTDKSSSFNCRPDSFHVGPGSPQLENGQPAIGKRSFEPGIRAFSFKQINKKNRVNASLSAFYASHCCPYHPEVPINKEFKA